MIKPSQNRWKIMKPEQIENPDIAPLKELCKSYIDYLDSEDYHDDNDYDHYIFERALETIYGPDVWEYVNSKME